MESSHPQASHTHRHPLFNRSPESLSGIKDKLHVVSVISNPCRYVSRYSLYDAFAEHIQKQELVEFYTAEVAFGRRPFEVTQAGNPKHLQLRTETEFWMKENMLNLLVQRLPPDWKYVAWIDADIEFQRKDWAAETIQQLQHYHVVQMFQQAVDLGPVGEIIQTHNGFAWSYLTGKPKPKKQQSGYSYPHWHPGFAWAMTRDAWDMLGGLYDVSFGSGDHLMAWAMIGENRLPNTMHDGYQKSLKDWMGRAVKLLGRDIGYTPGSILHYYHGTKSNRKYNSRWQILEKYKFNPFLDLKRDWQGLYQLDVDGTERMIKMRDEFRTYFRVRDEDNIGL